MGEFTAGEEKKRLSLYFYESPRVLLNFVTLFNLQVL